MSLSDLRKEIDQLDEQIVSLIAKRYSIVQKTLAWQSSSEELSAPKRVQQIIQKVRFQAEKNHIPAKVIEDIYRQMMAEFITLEAERRESSGD